MPKTNEEPRTTGAQSEIVKLTSQVYSGPDVFARVAAVLLAWQEIDRLRIIERIPDRESLAERMAKRREDFDLLTNAVDDFLESRREA